MELGKVKIGFKNRSAAVHGILLYTKNKYFY
jgi:hypothetical protein